MLGMRPTSCSSSITGVSVEELVKIMLSRIFTALLVVSFLLPSAAFAQILEEDETTYITKGFFMNAEYGLYLFAVKPSILNPAEGQRGPQANTMGSVGGFDMGFDLSDMFAIQVSLSSVAVGGNVQTGGGTTALLASLGATIYFMKTRFTVYGKLGAGLVLTFPSELGGTGLMTHAGLGFRYYTRLKHFSVALEARAFFRPPVGSDLSLGIGLIPSISYTF